MMLNNLSVQRKNLALLLCIVVMILLSLNFVSHHTLNKPFELRFMVSGILLFTLTIYLRYLTPVVNHLYKALYRIAAVMTFWSFGFFIFPTPSLILYLISFPAFYFLFRIEIKNEIQTEDLISCGFLLGLGTLIYLYQQPLQILLFDQQVFSGVDYFKNAPLLMLTGAGYMRLHKHGSWPGLCLLGTVLFLAGTILTSAMFVGIKPYGDVLCTVGITHLFLLFLSVQNPLLISFKSFCGLTSEDFQRYSSMIWFILLLLMHACALYLTGLPAGHYGTIILALTALLISVYRFRKFTLSLLLVESLLLFCIADMIIFPGIQLYWLIPSAGTLLICVYFRRIEKLKHLVPNVTILILMSLYYFQFSGNITLDYTGLIFALIPVLCWMVIPNRPLTVRKKFHWVSWPFITGVVLFFVNSGFDLGLLTVWALLILIPPSILYVILSSRISDSMMTYPGLIFLNSWLKSGQSALFFLTLISVFISAAGFTLNYNWFIADWVGVTQTMEVLLTGILIFLYMAASVKSTRYIMLAEFLIWAAIGLIRWKFETMGRLQIGSPADGYFLIAAAVAAAGIRESVRKKIPEFTSYFQKTTVVYGILGWLYLQVLQFVHTEVSLSFSHHGELASVVMAMLNFRLSKTIKRSNLIYTFVFANAAILLFFLKQDYSNLLYYVLPVSGSALVLVQLFKDSLPPVQVKNIRLIISLIICGTSGFYNMVDFNESIWYPVIATLVAGGGVLLGISLRIRIYLYMGLVFFVVNAVGVVAHIIISQPPENMLVFIALLFLLGGIPLIAVFVTLQIKRQQILTRYRSVMDEIGGWE